ncbi:hypothetical protein RI367_005320 [Sorochytrium milnesiophthora]
MRLPGTNRAASSQALEELGKKKGMHAPFHLANGARYIGEWADNKRHGRGTLVKKDGQVYEGCWANDMRCGFGTLTVPRQVDGRTEQVKVYAGDWQQDRRHGYGTAFYEDGRTYEGMWASGKKCGWGTMHYPDQSRYDGEWLDDKRHGQGILLLANHDRYEGMFLYDLKEGPGKFFYKSKKQYYEGEWSSDMPKCGMIKDIPLNPRLKEAARPYSIPKIGLADPEGVIGEQRAIILRERIQRLLAGEQDMVEAEATASE